MSNHQQDPSNILSPSRRRFLKTFAGALAVAGVSRSALAGSFAAAPERALVPERALSFYNLHTGESLKTAYWANGNYIPEALTEINFLLRDYRNGAVKPIRPDLLDLLHRINDRLDNRGPIHLISGYRSPATNAMLHEHHSGVAKHSLHMQGMATDIRVPGRSLKDVWKVAMDMRGGGVGFYRKSDFVHVDVGPVRHWGI